jgi:hypothetical protein
MHRYIHIDACMYIFVYVYICVCVCTYIFCIFYIFIYLLRAGEIERVRERERFVCNKYTQKQTLGYILFLLPIYINSNHIPL